MADADDDWLDYLGAAYEVIRRWEETRLYRAILTLREAAMLAEEIAVALRQAHEQGRGDSGLDSVTR
jgi:hypothetical protein